ncbi:MAG: sulfite dehydrogenase [Acidobacteria bacterium]|nr:sulfite dehydrogenase [Acidobacteriota bacterium]
MHAKSSNRRRFLKSGATLGAALVEVARAGPAAQSPPGRPAVEPAAPADPTKAPGVLARPYGERSRFEKVVRTPSPQGTSSGTPLQELQGIITPSALHFERHHAGVPDIDPRRHRLMIHGMVDHPLIFTMEELKRLPSVSRIYFIECSGNGYRRRDAATLQEAHGLTSCSEWTGVLLSLLLREAGVQKGASWLVAEGSDAAKMTRSIPLKKALDDVLVAYGQNGEALRPEQGYPLRLVVPGWEGNICVKWLRRIKVVDQPYMTREETSKYTDLMPDGKARQFSLEMDPKSVITFPSGGHKLPAAGFYEITGLAWSGRGAISKVEISTDGGNTWRPAELQEPVLRLAHTRFRFAWQWDGRETILQSRCTDENGDVQPTLAELVQARGENWGYHFNPIQSWRVAADGSVHNVAG